MVRVQIQESVCIFRILGFHRLLCLRCRVTVAIDNIIAVYPHVVQNGWRGWRLLGTSIPGVLNAGTFMKEGKLFFLDIRNSRQSIVVELRNHRYSKLLIEVEDHAATLAILQQLVEQPTR